MEYIVADEQEILMLQGFTKQHADYLWSLKLLVRDGRLGGTNDAGNPFKREMESEPEAPAEFPPREAKKVFSEQS
jgi:hypothetical protein